MNAELAPRDWRPQFVDSLILGLTTSTAFSPTDVMPIAVWPKLTMALQSLISLVVTAPVASVRLGATRCAADHGRSSCLPGLARTRLISVEREEHQR